jgi:hypothetical protein
MKNERRTNNRSLTAALVEVDCRTKRHVGVVEDLSNDGACFRMEDELPLNQQVVAFVGRIAQLCTIRHCQFEDGAWRVGVAFKNSWPEDVHTPIYSSQLLGEGSPAAPGLER